MNRREMLAASTLSLACMSPLATHARVADTNDFEWVLELVPWGYPRWDYPDGKHRTLLPIRRVWANVAGIAVGDPGPALLLSTECRTIGAHAAVWDKPHWLYRESPGQDATWFNILAERTARVVRDELLLTREVELRAVLETEGDLMSALIASEALRLAGNDVSLYAVVDGQRLPVTPSDLAFALEYLRTRAKNFSVWSAEDIPRSPDDDWCYRYQFVSDGIQGR